MYLPKAFNEEDKNKQIEFIKKFNFANLISAKNEIIEVTHIPLYFLTIDGKDYLLGHIAKANEHYKIIVGRALAVFNGPNAYVSEKWYEAPNVVPTWNYVAVHVSGNITTTSESELREIIEMMVKNHEGDFNDFKKNIDDHFFSSLMSQIVGIKMEIETIEGKWKLSQNRSLDAQTKIAAQLAKQKDHNANLIAELMNKNISEFKLK